MSPLSGGELQPQRNRRADMSAKPRVSDKLPPSRHLFSQDAPFPERHFSREPRAVNRWRAGRVLQA